MQVVAEKKSTHKVEVVPVALENHPNANTLSVVRVWGYQVVVKSSDWKGVDKAAYIQPDSVVPDSPEYAFLRSCTTCRGTGNAFTADKERVQCPDCSGSGILPLRDTDRHIRVRKFRGEMSQGLLVKAPFGAKIGDDVSQELGITRYVPPEPGHGGAKTGKVSMQKPPSCYVPDYDVENWYRYGRKTFKDGEKVIITEKIHGCNARYVYDSHTREFYAGTHHTWLREFFEVPPKGFFRRILRKCGLIRPDLRRFDDIWWRVVDKYPIREWCESNPDCVLYGEIYGDVQDLKYGCSIGEVKFAAFEARDTSTGENRFFDEADARFYEIPSVPVVAKGKYTDDFIRQYINGVSMVPGANHMREGVVIFSGERSGVKLKAVSDAYLERTK